MIAGLPWTAWLLILTATVPALVIALRFYFAHRHRSGHEEH